ncbi:YafY family transcriptional regulator [Clostridium sp. 19966]|uniref:helix-turn-helix transcriptional regulator n=1 Tax=Clostridium sp. 19966 TaxID=2768166 RepID=UPI0028DF5579|nr:YafY family protein [Clostridium sp. 19966]MDT8717155.1 YafY family transcriptional regulator [Clostridium sp. 19966]
MKIDRLLGIVTILLENPKVKAKTLAEKFEVSIRTIHRDIEDICKAGIPIVTYQGGDGGISIAEGYKLNDSILTLEDMNNIIIGLKGMESISNEKNVKMLLEKFQSRREEIIAANDSIFIDLASFYKEGLSSKIKSLREAIMERHKVEFQYFSASRTCKRIVDPYYISFKWGAWYLIAYCNLRNDFRVFKLNRMDKLNKIETEFQSVDISDEKLNMDNYFNGDEEIAELLIDKSMEYKIVDEYGAGSYEITEENKIRFQLTYVNKEYAIEFILSMGDKVKIISPDSLVEEIKNKAKNILSNYE